MLNFAAGCFLRSAVILASSLLLWRCLRGRQAHVRHGIVLLGFFLLAVEPLLLLCSPQLILSLGTHHANVTTQQWSHLRTSNLPAASPGLFRLCWPLLLYVSGAAFAGTNLWRGWRRAAMLRREAAAADDEWNNLVRELCRENAIERVPAIAIAVETTVPFVCGLWQPAIVLPEVCHVWPIERRRTVLLHELGHVKRMDLFTQTFASVVIAMWWFQPLGWFAYRKLRREGEAASDAFVIGAGVRASEYAADLLAIVHEAGCRPQIPMAAIGMAREHGLTARIAELLCARQPRGISRSTLLATISSLTALTMLVSAVTVDAQGNPKGGLFMKRAIVAGLLAGAGVSAAATVGGTIYDESGAALTDAKVVISDPDSSFSQELTSDAQGRFSFASLHEGEYIVRVQRPGFATLFREFHLDSATDVERGLTLQMNGNQTDKKQIRVPGTLAQSNLIRKVQPTYPVAAKTAGIQGEVKLEAVISKDGVPQDLRVTSSPNDDLSQSALEAVRQWRYQPTLLNGQPVDIVTEILVHYTLSR